jgi:hypothetical protein
MQASLLSRKRLIQRRLLRKGIDAVIEGGEVFFCEPVTTVIPTRFNFNHFVTWHRQLRTFENGDCVSDILLNKVNRFERNWAYKMMKKKQAHMKKERAYDRDEAVGELTEMINHVSKIRSR